MGLLITDSTFTKACLKAIGENQLYLRMNSSASVYSWSHTSLEFNGYGPFCHETKFQRLY